MSQPFDTLNMSTDLDAAPAANNPAVVTLAAPDAANHPGMAWVVGGFAWSYSAAPTGGNVAITNGGTTAFTMDISAAGAGFIIPPKPLRADPNSAVVITLAAGGAGISGKVNILGARLD